MRGRTGLCLALLVVTGCPEDPPTPMDVAFGHDGIDFARLEHELPLTPAQLQTITPANIELLSQEHVDQIYGRLSAGPIPDGAFDGDLFLPPGVDGESRLAEIVGGRLRAYAFAPEGHTVFDAIRNRVRGRLVDFKVGRLENLGRSLWKGKVFYRDASATARPTALLRNRIDDKAIVRLILRDESEQIMARPGVEDENLFFPAKVYCGQSLLDGRRESIVIDYAFSDEQPGYVEKLDRLAGRGGLQIRDEIRMVRPGFYLGRAYVARAFLLNFTLYNEEIAAEPGEAFLQGQIAEDCWEGPQREQARRAAAIAKASALATQLAAGTE